jgi:hypothetical protein
MRLGLFDRVRRFARLKGRIRGRSGRPAGPSGPTGPAGHAGHVASGGPASLGDVSLGDVSRSDGPPGGGAAEVPWPRATSSGRHRRDGEPAGGAPGDAVATVRSGSAQARVREAPSPGQPGPARGRPAARSRTRSAARARAEDDALTGQIVSSAVTAAHASMRARLPFTAPQARERPAAADGRRHCGSLERVIWRQWDAAAAPPVEVVAAIDRLAELPERIKLRLADGLDAIFVGPGGVPELDDMTSLRGVRLPGGHASWDVCAGAYGERKIVVGSRPSPTPDVMCHEIGHALDDIDSPMGTWQSDSPEFRMIYEQCQPHFASDFHRQPGGLGRKEFFADAFAAIASGQRPALVDMLRGETRTALRVMLYFNRRYDI